MNRFSRLSSLLFLLAGALLLSGWALYTTNFPVDGDQSRLWIDGTSNLHDWECEADQFVVNLNGDETLEGLTGGSVIVLSNQLDCDSNRMDRNTRDALKATDHQRITYEIASANVANGSSGNVEINLSGQLSLAGVQKNVNVAAQAVQMSDGRYRITGTAPLLMSDFGIDPPRAMMGALRTADEVNVNFDIVAGNGS